MTIASEITKLQSNLANSYTSCESKGATMPSSQNFDNLATTIDSIETGGGGGETTNKPFPSSMKAVVFEDGGSIPEESLKRACTDIVGSFEIINMNSLVPFNTQKYDLICRSKALQECFYGNQNVTTVSFHKIKTFAADSLLDCFLNSSVTKISVYSSSNYASTTGYANKWGAPTATINLVGSSGSGDRA